MPDFVTTPFGAPTREEAFIANLDKAIAFHHTNANDPYGIGNAVICSLTEVRNAFAAAHGLPLDDRFTPPPKG